MTPKNLSEELFKPRFKHPETSTLVRRVHHQVPQGGTTPLEGAPRAGWYRMINKVLWSWRGLSPLEIDAVLARIAMGPDERTDPQQLDTVVGYRNGNWQYEWVREGGSWQARALRTAGDAAAGEQWLHASRLYSIAAYPHIKGDPLAEQAQTLANRAYEEATARLTGELKELTFTMPGGPPVQGFLHMPPGVKAPYPTVLVCGSLDSLQSDYYRLFHDYLAPLGLAMLTLDMPSVGFSVKWTLNQDSSFLHQQVLRELAQVPWIDHTRVAAFGLRFGANIAVRLAWLEASRLKAVACLGPVVHALLSDAALQDRVPDMYMDVLASRLGMANTSDSALRTELGRYSLKTQGLLGRRCPTPLLSAFWQEDLFSPESESRLIVSGAAQGKLLAIPRTPLRQGFDHALHDIARWIAKRLR
ncbi:esterase FrsA [Pantoea sp. 1.19]|uniref:esterase FrsA n=1 Tax=Pantoea sp. 1.19 TaxID=1925589 RepID=UPI00094909E4|nr:esterase FrsA [Pantoea sp. 1.19]